MSARNRNPRRRAAFLEAAEAALAALPRTGDQNIAYEVDVRPTMVGYPTSGLFYSTDGYHELLRRLVRDVVFLERGQTITIRIPTYAEEKANRRLIREAIAAEMEGMDVAACADRLALRQERVEAHG